MVFTVTANDATQETTQTAKVTVINNKSGGAIGFLLPLILLAAWRRRSFRQHERLFAIGRQ